MIATGQPRSVIAASTYAFVLELDTSLNPNNVSSPYGLRQSCFKVSPELVPRKPLTARRPLFLEARIETSRHYRLRIPFAQGASLDYAPRVDSK